MEDDHEAVFAAMKENLAPPPLAAPRDMWEPESYLLIPPMDEHGIDERDLAGTDDDTQTPPPRMPRSHPDAARSPPKAMHSFSLLTMTHSSPMQQTRSSMPQHT
ncbi:MAG: hypothetical protein KAY24_11645 [Candidatus Eisenbacteria sp.]|nr:hypothetical protein [Candidatus Eisenbacteria bacterium]